MPQSRCSVPISYPLGPFSKHPDNPIMQPDPNRTWESAQVYNPTVIVEEGAITMLYRAEDEAGTSRIGLARSTDGINFDRHPEPILEPEYPYETPGGCEDPRLVKIDGTYYLTYTGYDGANAELCLATSEDLHDWEKHGPLFPGFNGMDPNAENAWNKAGAIIPEPIDGRYVMYWGVPEIWYAESEDLINWTPAPRDDPVLSPVPDTYLSELVEAGPTPIFTNDGNILLVFAASDGDEYTVSQALLSGEDPTEVVDYLEEPFLRPKAEAAKTGLVDDVLFPEGMAIYEGTVYLYFGMADSRIGVATYTPNSS